MLFWIEFHIREHEKRLRAEADSWRLMRKALKPYPRPAPPNELVVIRRPDVVSKPEMQRRKAA